MVVAWLVWIGLAIVGFAILEAYALRTSKLTLSRFVYNVSVAWPLVPARFRHRRLTMRRATATVSLVLLTLTLSSCAHSLGYAGKNPGRVACKGKGVLTVTASGALVGGFGGGNTGNFTVTGDCGSDGFSFEQGPPALVPPAK